MLLALVVIRTEPAPLSIILLFLPSCANLLYPKADRQIYFAASSNISFKTSNELFHLVLLISIAMSSTMTAAEQVNQNTLLPMHHQPPRAQPSPTLNANPFDEQHTLSRADALVSGVSTWFTCIKEYAPIIGIFVAIVTLVVTIIGIVVAAVITVAIK
ncbi:hypothetical protein BKA58DRAFT_52753 [Alternaria rosae]|uniref:uncharacterized protein n=1 Tax=Alternaria rosae TaxID=1187941 RepID=UPI001E8E2EF3|nr:uncharacterized protein BKA58DRAFT_52753 [Alternaria rosae]KAH6859045.1 hypothetical protein BKA58DRAFT_52753 [Alternaria rosae]